MKRIVLNMLFYCESEKLSSVFCRAALGRQFEPLQLSEATLLTHPKRSWKITKTQNVWFLQRQIAQITLHDSNNLINLGTKSFPLITHYSM